MLIDEVYLLHKTSPSRLGEEATLSNVHKPTQREKKKKKQGYVFQMKEKNTFPETDINGTEINELPNRIENIILKNSDIIHVLC